MNFSNIDPLTFALFLIETLVLIGVMIMAGIAVFKNYKGKNSMSVSEILSLQQDLTDYARKVYETISVWSDLNPDNFDSVAEYREFLIKRIVEDLDDLIKSDPDCPINSTIYNKLTYEDKIKFAEIMTNKIPSMSTDNTEDVTDDDVDEDEDVESEQNSDYVDIGDHLI